MRSTDERMEAVLGRARAREALVRRRRQRAVAVGGGALSVVAVVVAGIGVATGFGASSAAAGSAGPSGLMGSVFAGSPALGYIVVGLLGIVLGVAVATLAYRLGHGAGGISGETLPENDRLAAKPQVGKIPSESFATNYSEDEGRAP